MPVAQKGRQGYNGIGDQQTQNQLAVWLPDRDSKKLATAQEASQERAEDSTDVPNHQVSILGVTLGI